MSTQEQPLGSPDPEAVKSLLAGAPEPGVPRPLDVDIEAIKDLTGAGTGPASEVPAERVDTPMNNSVSPDAVSMNNMLAWSMVSADVGEVIVEEHEKSLFLKAALNDTGISFPVKVSYGNLDINVLCRTLSTWEMDVLYGALNEDERENSFRDVAQYTTAMQQYILAMQAVSVNEVALNHLHYEVGEATLSDHISDLREKAKKHVGKWGAVRWSSVLTALRVFTIKLKLCTDAAMNRDFWQPPGTV